MALKFGKGVTRFAAGASLWLAAGQATAATLADQLMEELLQRHLPQQLYQQDNNPWPGGNYQLKVFKQGAPTVVSQASRIRLNMPLKIELDGKLNNKMLRLNMTCTSSFETIGQVTFTPSGLSAKGPTQLQAEIELPIPPVMADCDGVEVPIENSMRAFVSQYKRQWEERVSREANAFLQQ